MSSTMLIGFEREYFIMREGEPIPAHTILPDSMLDGCGLIAEARSKPFPTALEAAYNLLMEEELLKRALPNGYTLHTLPYSHSFNSKEKTAARRLYNKDPINYHSIYGKLLTEPRVTHVGTHVNVTKCCKYSYIAETGRQRDLVYYEPFNFPVLIHGLDVIFSNDIKAAKRTPGVYAVKDDGVLEYRSLPAAIDIIAVADAVEAILKRI